METNADQGEQTSFQIAAIDGEASEANAAEDANAAESGADLLSSLLAPHIQQLAAFTDVASAVLAAARPPLQAFERFGYNLYLAGGAAALSERVQLSGDLKRALTERTLCHAGTNKATAQSFCERLDSLASRPRYAKLIQAGQAALIAQVEGSNAAPHEALPELIQQWADPTARGRAERVIFLLTDLVGSTAMTSKLGNSAAQRVVRAHNAVVREATKEFRGKEIKHTGDGMLVTFPDAAAAARAAIDIQQEAFAYAKDNPEAPLSLRLGLHTGDATFEDGEYYGEAVMLLDGICGAADHADYGKLTALWYDNRASDRAITDGQWAWRTKFWSLGYRALLPADVDFLAQAMKGTTSVVTLPAPTGPVVRAEYWSAYALLSKEWGRHRLSFRSDRFGAEDEDRFPDINAEHGNAFTLGYIFRRFTNHRVTLEVLHVDSRRRERAFLGLPVNINETQNSSELPYFL